MQIRVNKVSYNIGGDGETESVTVGFQGFNNRESLTTEIEVKDENLDNLNRNDLIEKGRERLTSIVIGEETSE